MKHRSIVKWLTLCGVIGLGLTLTSCYIPPDEISTGDQLTVGSNNLPFQPVATTPIVTATPTPALNTTVPGSQPTIDWDVWGTTNAPSTTTAGTSGTITVTTSTAKPVNTIATITAKPTNTPAPATSTPTPSSLKRGMSGQLVRDLQKRLKELGYYTGSVDGDFGAATEAAVQEFQQANGLTVDGKAGTNTLNKLNSSTAVSKKTYTASQATAKPTATPKPTTKPTATPKPTAKVTATPKPTATPDLSRDIYLRVGSSGKNVTTLQKRLIELGWMGGTADGEFGGATQAAVMAFQSKSGLWNDGVAGPDTLAKLYSSSASKSSAPVSSIGVSLKEGMNGDSVRALQKRLKALNYYAGTVDGDFGSATTAAVKNFQAQNGLTADGVAGTATLNKLYLDTTDKASSTPGTSDTISSTGYVTLREGDSGTAVRKLQQQLKTLGYYSGSVDSKYGSGTTAAVKAFQQANDLRVDGVAGPATQRALYGTSTSITYATLREGDTGSAVTNLQYTLYELDYYDGEIDGVYGDTTKDAVRAFQIQNNLSPVDGVAGNKTLQRLYSSSAIAASTNTTKFTTLEKGDKGESVVQLQDVLKKLGYLSTITGVYDSDTVTAVKNFQRYNGLTVDGKAGEATQQKLYSSSAVAYPGP
ncbi:MAG: peptidoglycan-binding protein [Aristaeellaceae bacterium]